MTDSGAEEAGEPDAETIRRAAAMATSDARAAWKEAKVTPDVEHTRAALRQCVLAVRIVLRAADALPNGDEQRRVTDDADRLEAAIYDLKTRLARIVENGQNGTSSSNA